jgi:hypothetical protein
MGRDPVKSVNFDGKSVWDIKMNKKGQFGIASIYDGYVFDLEKREKDFDDCFGGEYKIYEGHESICYAFEWCGDDHLITSSFYDSTIHLLKI